MIYFIRQRYEAARIERDAELAEQAAALGGQLTMQAIQVQLDVRRRGVRRRRGS